MKSIFLIITTLLLLVGCTPEEPRRTAFQANIDDVFYGAVDIRAEKNDDGSFTLRGSNVNQLLKIDITSGAVGDYQLGGNSNNRAQFKDFLGNVYYSNPFGEGVVTVTQNDEVAETISGRFEFTAVIPSIDTISVNKGVFYKVPYGVDEFIIEEEEIEEPDPATNAGQFAARIDNEAFSPFAVSAVISNNNITITGTDSNESISVKVPANATPGSYLFSDFGFEASYRLGANSEPHTQGNLVILVNDPANKNIKATFAFETENYDITLGYFDVIYEQL